MEFEYKILNRINSPADVKSISREDLCKLAEEMRHALIQKASVCGGHLGSNLGIVEITIAMHYVFDSPHDKFVFDVSHQTYCHKMLTGRVKAFIEPAEKISYEYAQGGLFKETLLIYRNGSEVPIKLHFGIKNPKLITILNDNYVKHGYENPLLKEQ